MAMEPIWESDFHRASYGFRPARSVHHAIRTVKLQLQESDEQRTAGRWVIEGYLASYFETVHHQARPHQALDGQTPDQVYDENLTTRRTAA